MLTLALRDAWDHAAVWLGALAAAIACGYIGGWGVSIEATARIYPALTNLSAVVLIFSAIAALATLLPTARLTVSAQGRSYALWQIAHVSPAQVTAVVLVQLALVALVGAMLGTALEIASYEPLFPLVFASYNPPAGLALATGAPAMPLVWLAVMAIFVLGGFHAALMAGRTPPLEALRPTAPTGNPRSNLRRIIPSIGCLALLAWYSASLAQSSPGDLIDLSLFAPILTTAAMIPLSPLLLSGLLRIWTSMIPSRWTSWFIARQQALHALSSSTSIEAPLAVGIGLVSGIFSLANTMGAYVTSIGLTGLNTTLDATSTLLLLGGPVLLAAVGATAGIFMTARSRKRDAALLLANGATMRTVATAALCEATIHIVTAMLAGLLSAAVSNVIIAHATGMPLLGGLAPLPGLVVAVVGFVPVLISVLVPTLAALHGDLARHLAQ